MTEGEWRDPEAASFAHADPRCSTQARLAMLVSLQPAKANLAHTGVDRAAYVIREGEIRGGRPGGELGTRSAFPGQSLGRTP